MSEDRRCPGRGCRRRVRSGHKTCGDRSCASAAGYRAREGAPVNRQPHRCAREGCEDWVPRRDTDRSDAQYRARKYCDGCRAGARTARAWRSRGRVEYPERVCARDGCGETFTSRDGRQRYHSHRCAVLDRRRPEDRKMCECGCGQMWDRPNGLDRGRFAARKFMSKEHYNRWLASPASAGWSRAKGRSSPVIPPTARAKPQPAATAQPVEPSAPTFRPGLVPVVVPPPPRVAPRPRFGLSRAAT